MLHFWLEVLRRALADFLSSIGKDPAELLFSVVVFAVCSLLVFIQEGWANGWRGMSHRITKMLRKDGSILAVLCVLIFIYHGFREPFLMWDYERQDAIRVKSDMSANEKQLLGCKGDWNTENARATLLAQQVTSQQGIINAEQKTVNTQQASLNMSQGTVNGCVVALAKINTPEPQKWAMLEHDVMFDAAHGKHLDLIFLTTNRPISPISFIVKCEADIKWMGAEIVGAGLVNLSGPHPLPDGKTYYFGVTSPAIDQTHPLLVSVGFDADVLGQCAFTPKS